MPSFPFSETQGQNDTMRVLLVDDDEDMLVVAKRNLEKRDPRLVIATATDGDVALESFRTGRYEAIVADYQMPRMDGLELLRHIRDEDEEMPYILFTGKGREEVAINALNYGANRYIQKK
jgi:DNA-binding response OmpR family regulator